MHRVFMKLAVALMVLSTLAIPSRTAGQTTEPDQTPPAGSPTSAPPQLPAPSPVPQPTPAVDRPVSWKLLFPNLSVIKSASGRFQPDSCRGKTGFPPPPSSEPPPDCWR